ncbi:hypothetical protein [Streptomyces sp. gCLA4]|uniref:hypothetical protein n=1 Tax=Streptomyces sp. gCLA4 TaxID=1873416 RepID=UPI0016036876|nr:hypothetical protein [Streptomyces sp. gCLA4]
MPRPEKPIAPDAPFGTFALRLRALRRGAGNPTYRAMAARVGHAFSVSTLAGAASGATMPSLDLTLAYAEACRGDRQYWTEQWFIARGADRLWPDEPWAATPPDPAQAVDAAAYVALLRELRLWAGSPSLHSLARLTGHARSSLGDTCAPHRTTVPSHDLVSALVRGCLLYACRSRPWLRRPTEGPPDRWIAGIEAAWLRTRHRLKLREAVQPVPAVRRYEAEAARDAVRPPAAPDPLAARRLSEAGTGATAGAAAEATGRLTAEAPPPVPVPGPVPASAGSGRSRHRSALPANLPPEVHELATALRELFDVLDVSTRRFARRQQYDASSVSRYLAGSRIPPEHFVHALLREAAENGRPVSAEVTHHLLALRADALRIVNPQIHRLQVLEKELERARRDRLALEERARLTEHRLQATLDRLEALRRQAGSSTPDEGFAA